MKLRLYIETSTPNAYHDDRAPLRQRSTRQFWALLKRYEAFLSDLVEWEISRCKDPLRAAQLFRLVDGIPSLAMTAQAEELAYRYLQLGTFTEFQEPDALHMALATASGMDYLVSWNFRHVAREKTRTRVHAANLAMGYNRLIRIVTPTDLLGDDR